LPAQEVRSTRRVALDFGKRCLWWNRTDNSVQKIAGGGTRSGPPRVRRRENQRLDRPVLFRDL